MNIAPIGRRERHGNVPLHYALALASLLMVGSGVTGGCSGYDKPKLTPEELDALLVASGWTPEAAAADGYDAHCEPGLEPGQGDLCTHDCRLDLDCNARLGRRVCTCEGGVYIQCICEPPEGWPYERSPSPTAPYCDRITGEPRYLQGDRCDAIGLKCVGEKDPEMACTCTANAGGVGNWLCSATSAHMPPPDAPKCEDFGSGMRGPLDRTEEACDTRWDLCVARDYYLESTAPRGCACLSRDGGLTLEWICGSTNRWFRPE